MAELKHPIGELRTIPIEQLEEHPENPRRGDVALITESLEHNGLYKPLVVQKSTMRVLAGNHTLKALRELQAETVEAYVIEVGDEQARRIMLVDNRTANVGGFDKASLHLLLNALDSTDERLQGTGYDKNDLQALCDRLYPDDNSRSSQLPELLYKVIVDCTSEEHQLELMEEFRTRELSCRPLIA